MIFMIRTFIAIELPEKTMTALSAVQEHLKQSRAGVRWVRPAGIHLTLKFLGSIRSEQVEDIAAACAQAVGNEPTLALRPTGLGCFPHQRNPRVIWVGLEGDVDRLNQIQTRLENVLEPMGFAPEKRPFHPHLTLGRVKDRRRLGQLIDAMAMLKMEPFNSFDADEIILYKSDLRPSGAIYTKLHRMPLAAPASP